LVLLKENINILWYLRT